MSLYRNSPGSLPATAKKKKQKNWQRATRATEADFPTVCVFSRVSPPLGASALSFFVKICIVDQTSLRTHLAHRAPVHEYNNSLREMNEKQNQEALL